MMIDYNVSDHWPDDDPVWLRSLVSSLDRRHGKSCVLPLTVILEEVLEWVELASGADAWSKAANRSSLKFDVDQSIGAVGDQLRGVIAKPLADFDSAFAVLRSSAAAVLRQSPGLRTSVAWTDVEKAANDLLSALQSDDAVGASWDDLVSVARDRTHGRFPPVVLVEKCCHERCHTGQKTENPCLSRGFRGGTGGI